MKDTTRKELSPTDIANIHKEVRGIEEKGLKLTALERAFFRAVLADTLTFLLNGDNESASRIAAEGDNYIKKLCKEQGIDPSTFKLA